MTFIVGCKLDDVVYLLADSAVTSGAKKIPSEHTSFGELHTKLNINSQDIYVEEAALKLSSFCNVSMAIAGNADAGWDFVRSYKRNLESDSSYDPVDLFKSTALSHSPLANGRAFAVFIAVSELQGARLLVFNGDGTEKVEEIENNQLVYKGPMPQKILDLITEQLMVIMQVVQLPKIRLTFALAALQNLGIHDYLLPHGIGGTFTGAYVDSTSVHNQPRIVYGVMSPDLKFSNIVQSGVFDTALIVQSLMNKNLRVYSSGVGLSKVELLAKKTVDKAIQEMLIDTKFDYVVLLCTQVKRVIVIEMRRRRESVSCTLSSEYEKSVDEYKITSSMKLGGQVVDIVSGKVPDTRRIIAGTSFAFLPFKKKKKMKKNSSPQKIKRNKVHKNRHKKASRKNKKKSRARKK